jgi:hypothetical protein
LFDVVIAPDDEQVLAWRSVPARRDIVNAAIAHLETFDDPVPQWSAA